MQITAKWLVEVSQIAARIKDMYAPGSMEFRLAEAAQELIIAWVEAVRRADRGE